jgi:hypothetical protein
MERAGVLNVLYTKCIDAEHSIVAVHFLVREENICKKQTKEISNN